MGGGTTTFFQLVFGINQRQLSHYVNSVKKPRPNQRQRIIDGIHKIGKELIAIV